MQADEAFFKLLRLGIGTCHDRDVALDKAGWAAVYDMACKQAVAAIVLDGVERLSIIQKPPMEVVMPWIGLVQQIETRNRRLNRTLVMVYDKFLKEGQTLHTIQHNGSHSLFTRHVIHSRPSGFVQRHITIVARPDS